MVAVVMSYEEKKMTKKMYQIIVLLPGGSRSAMSYLPTLQSFKEHRIHDIQWSTCEPGNISEAVNMFLKSGKLFEVKFGELTENELIDNLLMV
jgi:hypothetical protein